MMGGNNESELWGNPSLMGEGGIDIFLPFSVDQLQQLKDHLQDQTNFAFHERVPPFFRNIAIEEEIPPSQIDFCNIKKKSLYSGKSNRDIRRRNNKKSF